MNILGIGAPEIVIIVVIVLIVAGPERAMRWIYLVGREFGKIRAMSAEAMAVFRAEIESAGLDKDLDELRETGKQLQKMVNETPDPRRAVGEVIKEVNVLTGNGGKKGVIVKTKPPHAALPEPQSVPEAQPFKSETPQPAGPEAPAAEPAVEAAEPAAAEAEAAKPGQSTESQDPPDDGQTSTEHA
jgi:sec-independent protein translocase protein TatB